MGYILLAVFGLFPMESNHMHSMSPNYDDCPFILGEHSICAMDTIGHISAWKNLIGSILVNLLNIILPIILVLFLIYLNTINLARSRLYIKPLHENFITILFSQGILNSKAY